MDKRRLLYAPRTQRDLKALEKRFSLQILDDLVLLEQPPWPPRKVKTLRGTDYWEVKTGDYRTIFWPIHRDVVVLTIINRRDLIKALTRIDVRALTAWIQEHN